MARLPKADRGARRTPCWEVGSTSEGLRLPECVLVGSRVEGATPGEWRHLRGGRVMGSESLRHSIFSGGLRSRFFLVTAMGLLGHR